MPTYQYACTVCDERLEAVQSFTDAPLKECPVCGGALRKVFSAVGVVFKGSGFYRNDSRDAPKKEGDKKKEPAPAAAGASSSPEGGSSGKGAEGNTSAGNDAGGKSSSSSSSDGGSKGDGNSSGGKPSTAKPAPSGKPAERKSA